MPTIQTEEMITDLFSSFRCYHHWVDRPWTVCRAMLGLGLAGYAVVFALEVFRWEFSPVMAEASRFLLWWVLVPVWAASLIQGFRINWRRAGWAVIEAAVAGVLVLVFCVGLLDYAYHHERQQVERAIALQGPATTR